MFDTDQNRLGLALLAAAGPSATPASFGQRLFAGMSQHDKYLSDKEEREQLKRQREAQAQFQQMQMMAMAQAQQKQKQAEERQASIEAAYRGAIRSPNQQAMSQFGGPTVAAAQAAPGMSPQIDQRSLIESLANVDPMTAFQMLQPKPAQAPIVSKPGDIARDPTTGAQLWANPEKPKEATPTNLARLIQERDELPAGHPNRALYDQEIRKQTTHAPGVNIGMPKIDIKMGDSVAGQVGPMAKDSRIQAGGAVTMFDAADRIERALASRQVSAGPGTSQIQTVKQFVQKIGGGNDESIRQTQQVIRSLAKMAVEARKQLQGQGQITDNEARAVEKADGGNIDDLTIGELGDLVKLAKRAAHYTAKNHQDLIDTMEANEGTRGAAPFYKLRGLEPLLKHSPQLPQIGGAQLIDEADAILNRGRNGNR